MKQIYFILSLIVLLFFFGSCEKSIFCKNGSGEVISQDRSINNFTEIDFQIAGDLIIKQSDTLAITVEAQENLINEIETVVKDNKLIIKTDGCIKTKEPVTISLSMPDLNKISVSGSGNVTQIGDLNFNSLQLTISGSGKITLNDIYVTHSLDNNISGSGNITLSNCVATEAVSNNISGSGRIYISKLNTLKLDNSITGSGDIIISDMNNCKNSTSSIVSSGDISISAFDTLSTNKIDITGSGDVHNRDLPALDVNVTISGSGSAFVDAQNKLDVNIVSSGSVHYTGIPVINVNITGSGSLINDN